MKKYVKPIVTGTIILGVGIASWFGYKGKTSQTPNNTQVPEGAQNRYSETATPQATATSTETNTTSGYLFASDGTPFEIVNVPGHENESCVKVGGPFEDVDGSRHNVYRATEAIGGTYSQANIVTVYGVDGPVIFDARLAMPPETTHYVSWEIIVCGAERQ